MANTREVPEVRRLGLHDALHAAAGEAAGGDGDRAARLMARAVHLPPLHAVQVALDQLAGRADDVRRGGAWDPSNGTFDDHAAAVIEHAAEHRDALWAAHKAAADMIDHTGSQVQEMRRAMANKKKDDDAAAGQHPPQLTTTGEPHPLTQGGYDPNSDPQLPGNISDVEALKEGKTTRAQAEAIAAADAANAPPDADEDSGDDDGDADEAKPKRSRKKKAD